MAQNIQLFGPALSVSWLNPSIKSSEVFPDGFNSYRRDRPDGRRGGVFLLVSQLNENHQPEELMVDPKSDCEAVWVKVYRIDVDAVEAPVQGKTCPRTLS